MKTQYFVLMVFLTQYGPFMTENGPKKLNIDAFKLNLWLKVLEIPV